MPKLGKRERQPPFRFSRLLPAGQLRQVRHNIGRCPMCRDGFGSRTCKLL